MKIISFFPQGKREKKQNSNDLDEGKNDVLRRLSNG